MPTDQKVRVFGSLEARFEGVVISGCLQPPVDPHYLANDSRLAEDVTSCRMGDHGCSSCVRMRDALQVAPSDTWFRMRSPERAIRRAHRELRSAHRPHSTVATIAHRWGFTHLGRFATAHKTTYGQTPLQALRSAQ